MAKGGARAHSGPPPDPNALRRDRKSDGEWTRLPAEGRSGDAPAWPLSEQSSREAALWDAEWRRPQAVMWERNGQQLEVALYVRSVVDAESPKATVAARTLVRQQMEALGLSVPGLLRNRWLIVSDEITPRRRVQESTMRDRLKALDGGA
jgi:hypothetical protein